MSEFKDAVSPAAVLRCINVVVGVIMLTGAVVAIILESLAGFIIAIYTSFFAVVVIGLEIYPVKRKHRKFILRYAGFIYSLAGRGAFYIVVGILIGGYMALQLALGIIVVLVGLGYIVLEIVDKPDLPPSMKPPQIDDDDLESRGVLLGHSDEWRGSNTNTIVPRS